MAWWTRKKESLERTTTPSASESRVSIPKGMWSKCEACGEVAYTEELIRSLRCCTECGHHHRMPTDERIAATLDEGTWEELDTELRSGDPLNFEDRMRYSDRLEKAQETTGRDEAFVSGTGKIGGVDVSIGFFAFEFMGGSMGSVVGEKATRVLERAKERNCPALIFSASGGARMQEGILSLMQMAKTSAARAILRESGIPYVSVLLNPTTGGVAASFSFLGDVIIAEPRALIGFAGARIIKQTIGEELPVGFQRSEFLLEHGMVDCIVQRPDMHGHIATLLRMMTKQPAVELPA